MDETAWTFFRDHIGQTDSPAKWFALIFFTVIYLYFDMMRFPWVVPMVLAPVVILAVMMPRVRESRLVRFGVVVLVLGWIPLLLASALGEDNALGAGFLFAFAMPIGFLALVIGTIVAVVKTLLKGAERVLTYTPGDDPDSRTPHVPHR